MFLFLTDYSGRGSKVFTSVCLSVCLCVCVCVCPQDKIETAETTITAPVTAIVLANQLILGQKVKDQGHKVQKNY